MRIQLQCDLIDAIYHICVPPLGGITHLTHLDGIQRHWSRSALMQLSERELLTLWERCSPFWAQQVVDKKFPSK